MFVYICSSDEKRWSVSATMTSPDGFGEHVTSCVTSYGGVTPESPPSERYRHYVQYKLFVDVYVISTLCVAVSEIRERTDRQTHRQRDTVIAVGVTW